VRSGVRRLPGMVHTAPEPRCRPCAWKETSSVWKTVYFRRASVNLSFQSPRVILN
jgi:hypothetical protein